MDYLRVKQKDGNGTEFSIPKHQYEFAKEHYEVITDPKKPATDTGGNPNPPKHKTTVNKAAEEKQARASGRQATNPEEGA